MVRRLLPILLIGLALAAGVYLLVFRSSRAPVSTATRSASATPVPEVGILVAQPAEVQFPVDYAGRVAGFRDVEVRPLVGGLLLKREYQEGALVKKDQVLFRIDPATYQIALGRAEAQLQQAQAQLRQAEDNFKRVEALSQKDVASERQREEALAQRDQARASVQLAEVEINGAKLNLSYTVVNAPVSGVTALQSPPVGTLIQAQQTLLTTITQLDPAYVTFSFTDEEGQAFRALNERREKPLTEQDLTVELQYGGGRAYPLQGRIDTAARRVDAQTGTVQARAIFPNPDGILLPGQFVRVLIHGITLPNAIVIPAQAVSQGPQGPSVYVLGENDTARVQLVRLGPEVAGGWVISDGLKGGERVVVDGVIRVRPGAQVKPVPFTPEQQLGQQSTSNAGAPSGPSSGARP